MLCSATRSQAEGRTPAEARRAALASRVVANDQAGLTLKLNYSPHPNCRPGAKSALAVLYRVDSQSWPFDPSDRQVCAKRLAVWIIPTCFACTRAMVLDPAKRVDMANSKSVSAMDAGHKSAFHKDGEKEISERQWRELAAQLVPELHRLHHLPSICTCWNRSQN